MFLWLLVVTVLLVERPGSKCIWCINVLAMFGMVIFEEIMNTTVAGGGECSHRQSSDCVWVGIWRLVRKRKHC